MVSLILESSGLASGVFTAHPARSRSETRRVDTRAFRFISGSLAASTLDCGRLKEEYEASSILREGWPMKIIPLIAGKKVAVISPSASVHDLVNSLNTHHVGALVVSTDGRKIDGIVSERDVVRAMPGKLDQLVHMHVRDLMTVDVVTCTSDATVAELMTLMTERRIRHIPVVDDKGDLLSIVSIGDVVKAHITELDDERRALRDYVTH